MAVCLQPGDALQLYFTKRECGVRPSPGLVLAALKLCSKRRDVVNGRKIHVDIVQTYEESSIDIYIASTLVDMYSKSGSLREARDVFEKMQERNVVAWNCMILGYAENGQGDIALHLFQRMMHQAGNLSPTKVTFLALLKACVNSVEEGGGSAREWLVSARSVHAQACRLGQDVQTQVANTLTDMYGKLCSSMVPAYLTFNTLVELTVISWNCLIMGYANNRNGELALEQFCQMKDEGYAPDTVTYVAAIKACIVLAEEQTNPSRWLNTGRDVHAQAVAASRNQNLHLYLASTLVDMYCKCKSLDEAWSVFKGITSRSVVTWNCLIMGYANNGQGDRALELYDEMLQQRLKPDALTLVAAAKACVILADKDSTESLNKGRNIHRLAAATGYELHSYVASSLLDMYAKCGSMPEAEELFSRISHPDAVCWTSMILGYAQLGDGSLALNLYRDMLSRGLKADDVTYVAVLKACGNAGALEAGEEVVAEIYQLGLDGLLLVANSMVDFYGKCGSMVEAREVFGRMKKRDVVSWNALLDGYSRLGDWDRVFDLFECMQRQENVSPNDITLLCVLSACCHGGLVEQGKYYFDLMSNRYGISPGLKHYSCMVGLLGRANRLEEAIRLMNVMPHHPSSSMWMTLLGASWKWRDVNVGKLAFDSLLRFGDNAQAYVLMSNLYASSEAHQTRP